ncbi:MAG: hypothetical protein PHH59_14425 [Methylovulum sp.]|uniref:hypothetical protein n=1 Tax=Methylovulum sp. TaxID=1916980 RepID=UPI002604D21F|nr:hypothetical protein [Methylovulum sp.]MDD2725200.1 hypothetical protein [Methylovulum sp.]MDD5125441.1 hypothetical protein [Methylovulum sp.]
MSEINKDDYVDAEAIAAVVGKTSRMVQKIADRDGWEFITEKTRSRHPKKWFLVSALPADIHSKVVLARSHAKHIGDPFRYHRLFSTVQYSLTVQICLCALFSVHKQKWHRSHALRWNADCHAPAWRDAGASAPAFPRRSVGTIK